VATYQEWIEREAEQAEQDKWQERMERFAPPGRMHLYLDAVAECRDRLDYQENLRRLASSEPIADPE